MSWTQLLVTALWGGLMALERRAFLQAMFSRPLVAATVEGLLLGDVLAGLYVGVVFELYFLGGASLGGAHPDHDTLPAISAAAMAAAMGQASGAESTPATWALAILICAPFGRAGLWLENRLDRRARKYFGRAVVATDSGELTRAARQNLRAMWPQFVFYGLLCAGAAAAGPAISHVEASASPVVWRALAWAYAGMGVAAAAVAVAGSHAAKKNLWAVASAAVTVVVMLALRLRGVA